MTLIKRDLVDTFRHIPVALEDYWLLGFHWDNEYWTDYFLPIGLRTSPFIFDLFANGLYILIEVAPYIQENFSIIYYLDDFFITYHLGADPAIYERRFATICSTLGIRIKESKSITGTTANFNGIEFDTVAMEACLPQPKLTKAWNLVTTLAKKQHTTLQEQQSTTGYLAFCAKVIPVGRSFLRQLYNATTNQNKRQPILITANMRQDLR